MKIEIVKHKKNPLLKREEHILSVEHPGKPTPSRSEILEEVAKAVKASKDVIVIDSILTSVGKNMTNIKVLVYAKKEEIPEYKLAKMNKKKKGEKTDEAPAAKNEAPKTEAPKTEEPKTEEQGKVKKEEKQEDKSTEDKK
ncbi:MAG: hypothetical protein ABIJ92_02410 [Candidatus Aenigmatarchaeota archaeon]